MARHAGRQPSARQPTGEAVRITTASAGRAADIAARQKRYVIAMTFRTACFVAAIFVTVTWVRVLLIIGALVLPYVAVVMANASGSRSDGFALVNRPSPHPELPEGPASGANSGPDHL